MNHIENLSNESPLSDYAHDAESQEAYKKMDNRLIDMADEELLAVWSALKTQEWEKGELWDGRHVSMDDWSEAVYSEISKRGLKE